jgi:hypothetical protein
MMDIDLKENKRIIRNFLRANYTDERLAMLLAHAQSGRLSYDSCCCLIGLPSASHALYGRDEFCADRGAPNPTHYGIVSDTYAGGLAESAFLRLGPDDATRCRRLIPIVKAEIRRRDHERAACPLCWQSLGVETIVHNECATRENMLAEQG